MPLSEILTPKDPYFGTDDRDFSHLRLDPMGVSKPPANKDKNFVIKPLQDIILSTGAKLEKGRQYQVSVTTSNKGYTNYWFHQNRSGFGTMLKDAFLSQYKGAYEIVPPEPKPHYKPKPKPPKKEKPTLTANPQETTIKLWLRKGWKTSHYENETDMVMVKQDAPTAIIIRPDGTAYRHKPTDFALPKSKEKIKQPYVIKAERAKTTPQQEIALVDASKRGYQKIGMNQSGKVIIQSTLDDEISYINRDGQIANRNRGIAKTNETMGETNLFMKNDPLYAYNNIQELKPMKKLTDLLINEKWDKDVKINNTGENTDKTIDQLKNEKQRLMDNGGSVSAIQSKNFAIRAKQGWKPEIKEGELASSGGGGSATGMYDMNKEGGQKSCAFGKDTPEQNPVMEDDEYNDRYVDDQGTHRAKKDDQPLPDGHNYNIKNKTFQQFKGGKPVETPTTSNPVGQHLKECSTVKKKMKKYRMTEQQKAMLDELRLIQEGIRKLEGNKKLLY